jgi:hypothetical protein
MKQITKISIKHIIDPSPDLSWLETKIEDEKIVDSCRYTDKDIAQYGIEQVQEWIEQDRRRLAECGETWHMTGIFAEASIQTSEDGRIWMYNTIRSSGIWSVESDSNDAHLRELEAEQFEELQSILVDLDFTAAEIEAAFSRDLAESHRTRSMPETVGIPYVDGLTEVELRSTLAGIYRWMYWREDEEQWDPDKDVSGSDTVQMLCELVPGPLDPEDIDQSN